MAAAWASFRVAAPAAASPLEAFLEAILAALAHFQEQQAARALPLARRERHSLPAAVQRQSAGRPLAPSADNQRAASALEPAAVARALLHCTRGRHQAVAAPAIPPGRAWRAARAQRLVAFDLLDLPQAHQPTEEAYYLPYSRLLPSL